MPLYLKAWKFEHSYKPHQRILVCITNTAAGVLHSRVDLKLPFISCCLELLSAVPYLSFELKIRPLYMVSLHLKLQVLSNSLHIMRFWGSKPAIHAITELQTCHWGLLFKRKSRPHTPSIGAVACSLGHPAKEGLDMLSLQFWKGTTPFGTEVLNTQAIVKRWRP